MRTPLSSAGLGSGVGSGVSVGVGSGLLGRAGAPGVRRGGVRRPRGALAARRGGVRSARRGRVRGAGRARVRGAGRGQRRVCGVGRTRVRAARRVTGRGLARVLRCGSGPGGTAWVLLRKAGGRVGGGVRGSRGQDLERIGLSEPSAGLELTGAVGAVGGQHTRHVGIGGVVPEDRRPSSAVGVQLSRSGAEEHGRGEGGVVDVAGGPHAVAVAVDPDDRPGRREELHRSDRAVPDGVPVELAGIGVTDLRDRAGSVEGDAADLRARRAVGPELGAAESAVVGLDPADRGEKGPGQPAGRVDLPDHVGGPLVGEQRGLGDVQIGERGRRERRGALVVPDPRLADRDGGYVGHLERPVRDGSAGCPRLEGHRPGTRGRVHDLTSAGEHRRGGQDERGGHGRQDGAVARDRGGSGARGGAEVWHVCVRSGAWFHSRAWLGFRCSFDAKVPAGLLKPQSWWSPGPTDREPVQPPAAALILAGKAWKPSGCFCLRPPRPASRPKCSARLSRRRARGTAGPAPSSPYG